MDQGFRDVDSKFRDVEVKMREVRDEIKELRADNVRLQFEMQANFRWLVAGQISTLMVLIGILARGAHLF
ncbi:MAG: hypothetical protein V4463_23820 [Pseudomonadota bacterium]